MEEDRLQAIKTVIKETILIDRLGLEDISAQDIGDDEPLFEGGLGLDSVEAVQIVVSLEQIYGVRFDGVSVDDQIESFGSVNRLAQFVYDRTKNAS